MNLNIFVAEAQRGAPCGPGGRGRNHQIDVNI